MSSDSNLIYFSVTLLSVI